MNYSEMLNDFLDSSLNGSEEETLFRALASDDELRFEMKYLLKLRDAVREDDEAAVVPIASTNAIFAQLGYTAPAAIVGAAGGVVGTQAGLWTVMKSAGGYLLAMLVGAVVTSGIFLMNEDSDDAGLATATKPTTTLTQGVPGTSTQATPSNTANGAAVVQPQGNNGAVSSVNTDKLAAAVQSPQPIIRNRTLNSASADRKNESLLANAQRPSATDAEATTQTSAAASSQSSSNGVSTKAPATNNARANALAQGTPQEDPLVSATSIAKNASQPVTESRSSDLDSPTPFTFEEEKPKEWRKATLSLGVRAAVLPFELKSATTALPESSQGIDNISASISYPLPIHRNLAFMVEAGKESYLLTFNERRSDGRIFQHEVMPSVFWAGVGARYSFAPQSAFNPFVQVVGGGSEAGMIGRSMLGLQWSLTDQIGMIGGLEYNIAAYRFQGETTTSPKLGLNYGITFNLFGN